MNEFLNGGSNEQFEDKIVNENCGYLAFSFNKTGDGENYVAEIRNPDTKATVHIVLPHSCIDAYVYALESIKQELDLLRMKNGVV